MYIVFVFHVTPAWYWNWKIVNFGIENGDLSTRDINKYVQTDMHLHSWYNIHMAVSTRACIYMYEGACVCACTRMEHTNGRQRFENDYKQYRKKEEEKNRKKREGKRRVRAVWITAIWWRAFRKPSHIINLDVTKNIKQLYFSTIYICFWAGVVGIRIWSTDQRMNRTDICIRKCF